MMTTPSAQTIIFCGDKEPLLIELQITMGDQPFQTAWRNGFNEIIHQLDKDKNGVLTREETDPADKRRTTGRPESAGRGSKANRQETAKADPRAAASDAESLGSRRRASRRQTHAGRDRDVSGPPRPRGVSNRGFPQTDALLSPQPTNTNNSGERLLSWLDQDGNRQLTAEELRTADPHLEEIRSRRG